MKILVCGLPESGKTWLAMRMAGYFKCPHFNADKVRAMADDWRFDKKARHRQANRLSNMADFEHSPAGGSAPVTVTDFVCPTEVTRALFNPGLTIWLNTKENETPYADTKAMWEDPLEAEVVVESFMSDEEIRTLCRRLVRDYGIQIQHEL